MSGQPPENPYGENPYGQNPYGQQPNPSTPQPAPTDPFAQPPAGGAPYGQQQPGAASYGQQPTGDQYGQQPYGAPQYGTGQYGAGQYGAPQYGGPGNGMAPKHPSATTAMVLGLVGLIGGFVLCGLTWLISPFAWAVGARTIKSIDASGGSYSGRDQAKVGMITGIVGTVLLVLALLLAAFVVVVAVNTDPSTWEESSSYDDSWESDF